MKVSDRKAAMAFTLASDVAIDATIGGLSLVFIDGAIADLSKQPIPNAPRWTASADAQYTFPIANSWDGAARLEWFYRDETYSDLIALARRDEGFPFVVPGYDNVKLRVGVESERFNVTAGVENPFDEKYFINGYEKSFVSGMALQPS